MGALIKSCERHKPQGEKGSDDVEKPNELDKKWGKLIAQCWADEAFKQRFIADPAAVMKEAGLEVPEGVEFKVAENTDKVQYILLPEKPGELSDEQLDGVSGGGGRQCYRKHCDIGD